MAQVTGANGDTYNWSSKETAVRDRLSGLSFTTKRGEGFSSASCTLTRPIDRDWEDLRLLDSFKIVGVDGTVAYEGRLATQPRSWDTAAPTISPAFVGWMGETKRRKFREVYVDRDFSAWVDPPLNERVRLSTATIDNQSLTMSSDSGGLVQQYPNNLPNGTVVGEWWYVAPPGVKIGSLIYAGTKTSDGFADSATQFYFLNADSVSGGATASATLDTALHAVNAGSSAGSFAVIYFSITTAGGALTLGTQRRITKLAAYGNHGLFTTSPDGGVSPDGLYISDMIKNILQRFCPKLSTAGVQTNQYILSQAAFKDRTFPYDAIQFLNGYSLWEMNVWDGQAGPTFYYYPIDVTDYDWEVRAGEEGVTVDLQGDSTEDLANGVAVEFTDVTTGRLNELTPDTTSSLRDTNVENEANRHGDQLWLEISLSFPETPTDATTIAQIALAEFNQPKAPGTIKVSGHIRDRQGHWQQAWKVRASDRVVITNYPNTRARIVNETSWDDGSKSLTIACDTTFKRLDAVIDRIGTALASARLTIR